MGQRCPFWDVWTRAPYHGDPAAWLTRVAGLSFITYFERDQDWGDGGIQNVVQQHYDLGRREGALRHFLAVAFNRVVQPLKEKDRQLPPRPPKL
jgi:hypothetical protein